MRIKGFDTELYWPYEDLRLLHAVLSEQLLSWHWHRYQIAETQVQRGDIVFDCGAAEGFFALLVKDVAQSVYCAEPLTEFQRTLRRTFQNDPNVTVLPIALADRVGRIEVPDNNGGQRQVAVDTVDAIRERLGVPIHYLKGDVEGYEMAVLRGAQATISKFRPRLAFACYHPGQSAAEMMAFLKACNPDYRFFLKGFSWYQGVREPMILHAW